MIDENNQPYLIIMKTQAPYFKKEIFQDENGNECSREVQIFPDPTEKRDYDLKSAGWVKRMTWCEISKREIFKPIENSVGFQKVPSIILSTYDVDVTRCPCLSCAENRESYDYIKSMPTGLYSRCFHTEFTVSFYINKSMVKHGVYKLLNEKEITTKQAAELIKRGCFCGDIGLRRDLAIESF